MDGAVALLAALDASRPRSSRPAAPVGRKIAASVTPVTSGGAGPRKDAPSTNGGDHA